MKAQPKTEFAGYRSRVRVLAQFFKNSRDRWKQKYMNVKAQIKRFKNHIYQLKKAKESWKQQALARAEQIEALQDEVEQLKAQLHESPSASELKSSLPPTLEGVLNRLC
jgi:chromosome segregation ATPase